MTSKPACLIDGDNIFTRFVMVHGSDGAPEGYRLEFGEIAPEERVLFDCPVVPDKKTKPRWDETSSSWVTTATSKEIEAATKAEYESMGRPYPPAPPQPSAMDTRLEEQEAAIMELAEMVAQQETINQEQDSAIMEIGGMISG